MGQMTIYNEENTIGYIEADYSGDPPSYDAHSPTDGKIGNSFPQTLEWRGYIDFDTSVLPASATITAATLRLYYYALGGPPPDSWSHRAYAGSDVIGAALTSADWGAAGFSADGTQTPTGGWVEFTITASKINKSGNTSFEMRDISSSATTGSWTATFYSTSLSRRPQLVVSYSLPTIKNANLKNCKIYNA